MKKHLLIIISVVALILSACQSQPIRVACVGDSITFGHGIKDREHDAYPGLLSAKLGDKYDVRNFGVSGSTTMMGTDMPYMNEQAYKDALAFNPQLPVPAYGHAWSINDSVIFNGVIPFIKEVAQEENLPLVDLNTPMQGKRQYFPDTIHPNEEGQQIIADIVFENVFKR